MNLNRDVCPVIRELRPGKESGGGIWVDPIRPGVISLKFEEGLEKKEGRNGREERR